jgi:N-acetylmuramoyl-L-alanine amidase
MRDIRRIIVHCTAGNQKQTKNDLLREFKARGWKAPGYHYVVFPNGKVEQLLDDKTPSNGVQGYNSTSINVAYVGGVDSKLHPLDNRTQAQKDSLHGLLFYLKQQYPNAHIMGHRDIWGKDSRKWKKWCPCFDAEAEYASIDDEIKASKYSDAVEQPKKYTKQVPNSPVKPVSYIDKIKKLASWAL